MSSRTDWASIDAAHDAHQDRLLAEARGQRIANPAAWETTARWRLRKENYRKHRQEAEALGKFIAGGNTDLFGRLPVLRGEEYKTFLRLQSRAAARKRAERKRNEA